MPGGGIREGGAGRLEVSRIISPRRSQRPQREPRIREYAREARNRSIWSCPPAMTLKSFEMEEFLCVLGAPTVSPLVPAVQLQCLG